LREPAEGIVTLSQSVSSIIHPVVKPRLYAMWEGSGLDAV